MASCSSSASAAYQMHQTPMVWSTPIRVLFDQSANQMQNSVVILTDLCGKEVGHLNHQLGALLPTIFQLNELATKELIEKFEDRKEAGSIIQLMRNFAKGIQQLNANSEPNQKDSKVSSIVAMYRLVAKDFLEFLVPVIQVVKANRDRDQELLKIKSKTRQAYLETLAVDANLIQKMLSDSNSQDHIKNTRAMIKQGARVLDPKRSITLVCGAQFFNQEIVEPLDFLITRSRKVILIDCDANTLKGLLERVKNKSKVVTVVKDLRGDCIEKLIAFEIEAKEKNYTLKQFTHHLCQILEAEEKLTPIKTLLSGCSDVSDSDIADIDYVVSSLVASEIASGFKRYMDVMLDRMHPENISGLSDNIRNHLKTKILDLVTTHVYNLFEWVNMNGFVYYADTVDMHDENNKKTVMFPQELLNILVAGHREQLACCQWKWLNKGQEEIYGVFCTLYGRKK